MDLGKILDGTPEPPSIAHTLDYFANPQHDIYENTQGDYCLPVPMTEFQRQLSDEVVSLHYSDILRFYQHHGSTEGNQVLSNSLQALYTNSQLVATHPFLLVDHYLPPNLLLKGVPNQLSKTSGKFTTLVNIIDLVRDKRMEIALVSRPGRSFDLIEALLLGKMINIKRHSGTPLKSNHKTAKKYSTIHLISSSHTDSSYLGEDRFDLVVAFDQTFNIAEPHIQRMRSQARTLPGDQDGSNPEIAPVLRLIPYYSAEHIASKLQSYAHDHSLYMKRVVAAIVILRGRVGTIPIDLRPYYAQGLKFLEPWLAQMKSGWPLPPVPEIEEYSELDVENSLLTEIHVPEPKRDSATPTPVNGIVNGNGNGSGSGNGEIDLPTEDGDAVESEEDEYYDFKRIKRETYSPDVPETSLGFWSLSAGLQDDRQILTHKILRSLEHAIEDLAVKDSELVSLQKLVTVHQGSINETMGQKKDFIKEIQELEDKLRKYEIAAEKYQSEVSDLREIKEKNDLELEVSRKTLLSDSKEGAINFVKIENQREEIAELELELRRANEVLESRVTEHNYMREEYDKATVIKSELAIELETLKTQSRSLESQVDTMVADMKRLTFESSRKEQDQLIKDLENKLSNSEEHLKRVIDSEKLSTRSRYGMRSANTGPRRTPSATSSRRSSVSDREGNSAAASLSGPHPLQNMTKYN